MNNKLEQHWSVLPSALKVLIISLFALGLLFRFIHLGDRPYWHDETYTLLRASGHTIAEMTHQSFDGRIIDRSELLRYQQITPDKTLQDTLQALTQEGSHRGMFYHVIMRLWMQTFGDSVFATRLLLVLLSLLAFPALYWLAIELFHHSLTAWIAVALLSVSPFFVYYAQEIREYALWTVTLLMMSAAFLRSLRLNTKSAWRLYTLTLILSLYTFIFSTFVLLGQVIYLLAIEGCRWTSRVTDFLKAVLLGGVVYLPWSLLIAIKRPQIERNSAWMSQPIPFKLLIEQWITNFQFVFLKDSLAGALKPIVAVLIVLLVGFSFRTLMRQTPKTAWIFLMTLVLPIALSLTVPDVVLGGIRSTNSRYFVPCYLGMLLAVSRLLATRIMPGLHGWRQLRWSAIAIALIAVGVLSCRVQAGQIRMSDDRQMAALMNQFSQPLIVSNEMSYDGGGTIGDVMVLSHLVTPNTQFQLVIEPNVPQIPQRSNVFVYKPLPFLKQHLEQRYKLESVYSDKLFRLSSVDR